MVNVDYEIARTRMIKEQLIARDITDTRVLKAMSTVPRHMFVDQAFWPRAYGDHSLPIGNDQTISQPYTVGLICRELQIPVGKKILEIGTGSGYQSAVLSLMGYDVYTIERIENLSKKAMNIIKKLGIKNIHFKIGDGTLGWKEEAPFDGIVVTAGAPSVPETLTDQLNIDGRIIIPVGTLSSQILQVIIKGKGYIEKREAGGCNFVPLLGENGWKSE